MSLRDWVLLVLAVLLGAGCATNPIQARWQELGCADYSPWRWTETAKVFKLEPWPAECDRLREARLASRGRGGFGEPVTIYHAGSGRREVVYLPRGAVVLPD